MVFKKSLLIFPLLAVLGGLFLLMIIGNQGNQLPNATEVPKLPPGVEEIQWEQLIPKDWNPRATLARLDVDKFEDNDPRAKKIMAKIRAEWDQAPVVEALNGKQVSLSGFVVTLEGDESGATEFLLVPFYGSCIHVPPPPSNQVVHVFTDKPVPAAVMFNSVRVIGRITAVQAKTSLASVGYQIKGAIVEDAPWQK